MCGVGGERTTDRPLHKLPLSLTVALVGEPVFTLLTLDMSNNNASSNLVVAQRVVKQLRLEASVRRIKVNGVASATLTPNKHGRAVNDTPVAGTA